MNIIKVIRTCCMTLGTALLLAALFLVIYNIHEDREGGEQAEAVLSALKQEIPDNTEETTDTFPAAEAYDLYAAYEEPTEPAMPIAEIGGNSYLGYLSIPELDVELPVLSEWSYAGLKQAPCRFKGDLNTNDLIICAHNYSSHFGRIHELNTGSRIYFTDVAGKQYPLSVISLEVMPGTALEMMQYGDADDWDLTLFTCTLSGQSRVIVRAERVEE